MKSLYRVVCESCELEWTAEMESHWDYSSQELYENIWCPCGQLAEVIEEMEDVKNEIRDNCR